MAFNINRELNYLKMTCRFEKITFFHCKNFKLHLTYNSSRAWQIPYAMLLLNYKRDDSTDLLKKQLARPCSAVGRAPDS